MVVQSKHNRKQGSHRPQTPPPVLPPGVATCGNTVIATRHFRALYTQGHYVQTQCHEYLTRPLRPGRTRPRRPKSRPVSVSPLARNEYTYAPFIAKSKAACGLCFHHLGGHVELLRLMRKYDVIHKTGVRIVSQR